MRKDEIESHRPVRYRRKMWGMTQCFIHHKRGIGHSESNSMKKLQGHRLEQLPSQALDGPGRLSNLGEHCCVCVATISNFFYRSIIHATAYDVRSVLTVARLMFGYGGVQAHDPLTFEQRISSSGLRRSDSGAAPLVTLEITGKALGEATAGPLVRFMCGAHDNVQINTLHCASS